MHHDKSLWSRRWRTSVWIAGCQFGGQGNHRKCVVLIVDNGESVKIHTNIIKIGLNHLKHYEQERHNRKRMVQDSWEKVWMAWRAFDGGCWVASGVI